MALRLSLPSTPAPPRSACCATPSTAAARVIASPASVRPSRPAGFAVVGRRAAAAVVARSSLEASQVTAVVGQVTEVDKDTFWPIVESAGSKTVVLDMYTQWCGPCKVMAPRFQELSEKYLDTVFLKLDCNQENKSLAKELGIRVVPTFKILKEGKIVKEVTGAKYDDLVLAIETVRSS